VSGPENPADLSSKADGQPPKQHKPIIWIAAGLAIWLLLQAAYHFFDIRIWSVDINVPLRQTLELVDLGRFSLTGNPLDGAQAVQASGIAMGPLGYMLFALPLLISRDIHSIYYFLTLMNLPAILIFWLACGRLNSRGPFRWVASALFAFQPMLIPFSAEHMFLQPLFLAVMFLFFVMANQGREWAIPLLYMFTGICVQLHPSSALLLVPIVVVSIIKRKSWIRWLAYTGLGVLLLAATNTTVLAAMIDSNAAGQGLRTGSLMQHSLEHISAAAYFKMLLIFLVFGPLCFGIVGPFFVYPALVRSPRTMRTFPDHRPLIWAALSLVAVDALVLPVLFAIKGAPLIYYLAPLSILIIPLIGLDFQRIWEQRDRSMKRLKNRLWALAVMIMLLPACLIGAFEVCPDHWLACHDQITSFRLGDFIRIGDKMVRTIDSENLHDVQLTEARYRYEECELMLNWSSSDTLDSLLLYQHPRLRGILRSEVSSEIEVRIWPVNDAAAIPPLDNADLQEIFGWGCLNCAIYLRREGVEDNSAFR